MRLFSYVVTFDTGFAPNPFWGFLTLACCKPKIRLTASPGDLVVGLAPSRFGNGVVFVARIDEKMTFHQYWRDPRFEAKRPRADSALLLERCGDNIYQPVEPNGYRQLHSAHSKNGGEEDEGAKQHDLSGRFVLASRDFSYFGAAPIPLPDNFRALIVTRGHRSRFLEGLVAEVDGWRRSLPRGVLARGQEIRVVFTTPQHVQNALKPLALRMTAIGPGQVVGAAAPPRMARFTRLRMSGTL